MRKGSLHTSHPVLVLKKAFAVCHCVPFSLHLYLYDAVHAIGALHVAEVDGEVASLTLEGERALGGEVCEAAGLAWQ